MLPMRDGQTTNEQGKIELLSQMDAGWLSFAMSKRKEGGSDGSRLYTLSIYCCRIVQELAIAATFKVGEGKKFHVYPQILLLWSNLRLII